MVFNYDKRTDELDERHPEIAEAVWDKSFAASERNEARLAEQKELGERWLKLDREQQLALEDGPISAEALRVIQGHLNWALVCVGRHAQCDALRGTLKEAKRMAEWQLRTAEPRTEILKKFLEEVKA